MIEQQQQPLPVVVVTLPPKPEIPRSPKWAALRAKFLKLHPACEACGTNKNLEVHHIAPFHLNPELELRIDNLFTLCESTHICHFTWGHFFDWSNYNLMVKADAAWFKAKLFAPRQSFKNY